MTNWKDYERACAALISGKRWPANMGGKVDVESDNIVGQCKEVAELSLAALVREVVAFEVEAKKKGKVGVLFIRHKAGRGNHSPGLVVMTQATFDVLNGGKP